MKANHKLALYIGYYLARFDKKAYENLGHGTQKETHEVVGVILSVNPNTIKNMRDEFDPLFGNRAGWYQKVMTPSRAYVAKALEDLDDEQILILVRDILNNKITPQEKAQLTNIIQTDIKIDYQTAPIIRGITGKAAEKFFIETFEKTRQPVDGYLTDTRDHGCGYDFEIASGKDRYFIEVKGLAEAVGGILFTDKEWRTAKAKGESYFLAIVSNLDNIPMIKFISNPFKHLNPQRNIYTSIQVQWSVSEDGLRTQLK